MAIWKVKPGTERVLKEELAFDEVPTEGSHNLVESGAAPTCSGGTGCGIWSGNRVLS